MLTLRINGFTMGNRHLTGCTIHKFSATLKFSMAVVAALAIVGCNNAPSGGGGSNAGNGGTSSNGKGDVPVVTQPLFKGWDKPRAVLVFSGEQHGYVEPCGCSETQSGGLARRHDLFKQLEKRGWPAAGLDLGGTLKRARKQSELKFGFTHKGLAQMNYKGMGFGPEELRMGADFLFTAFSEAGADERASVPFVSANVVFYGSRDLGTPTPIQVFEVGDVKVAVTSIISEKYTAGMSLDPNLLTVEKPVDALTRLMPEIKATGSDIQVLLSHAPPDESMALLQQFPQFDVVVTAEGPEDPMPEPETYNQSMLLRVSQKGKSVGVIGIYGDAENPQLRFELVNLDKDRFKTSLDMVALMQGYQDTIADLNLAANEPAVPHPTGEGFVGAETCGKCHTKAYKTWSQTRHAKAFESLAHGRPGMAEEEWVNRQKDPECLACHVTGWEPRDVLRFEGGFVSAEQTPHLASQGCENCHGPGQTHTKLETALKAGGEVNDEITKARKAMWLHKDQAKTNLCVKCHDLDNSPKFDFDLYWPKVRHVGRD